MPKMSNIEILQRRDQPTLVIRKTVKVDDLPGVIKAGKVIFCMYRGPYSEMTGTYNEMAEWLENSGLKSEGTVYEYYYNGPGFPENEFLTKIVMPLA